MMAAAFSACGGDGSVTEATGTETDEITTGSASESEKQTAPDDSQKAESEAISETDSESASEEGNDSESESEQVSETETEIVLDVEYGKTIALAEKLSGTVNMRYSDNRNLVVLSNRNVVIEYPLNRKVMGDGSIKTTDGKEYVSAISKPFIRNTDGAVFFSAEAAAKERFNSYRLGSYYYEIHLMDGEFASYDVLKEHEIKLTTFRSGNDISKVTYPDGILTYTVTETNDPNLNSANMRYSTEEFNAVAITIKSDVSTSGRLYLAAGSYSSVNADQSVSFSLSADGEFHTVYIPIYTVPDYTGNLTKLRFDIGSKVGEQIQISSIKMVQLAAAAPAVKLDRTYHLYSDKVNEVTRLVASEAVDDLASFGSVTEISADTVAGLVIKDKNGTHDSLNGVDMASVEYVAFDIKGVGVFGYILLPDVTSGKLTVTLADGKYTLTQEYVLPEGTVIQPLKDVKSGCRLYTDRSHSFEAFLKAAEEERHPLTEITVAKNAQHATYAGYDPFRGAYMFDVRGFAGFQAAYDNPYHRYMISPTFGAVDAERQIYVVSHTVSGQLESGALMSKDGLMLPVDLEVCKNFGGEHEEPFYDDGDTTYGEIIFPMVIEAGKDTTFHIINLYQNWGNFPLKQMSSIQFHAPYYHLSYGTTETNCIAPYFVYGKDRWTLPDFRAMSAPLWATQPQHTSIGRLYFLEYTDAEGKFYASESIDNKITSYGPTYCDIDMNYLSDDGRISAYYRHMEMPHSDENRTYYEIVLKVNEDIAIEDFKNDFAFFSFDGRSKHFKQMGYLNEDNECVIKKTSAKNRPTFITLGDQSPYVSLFDGPETQDLIDHVNFALVVKNYSFTVGGKAYDGNLVLREILEGGLNRISLTLDLDEVTLKKGDLLKINMILLPWGDPSFENDQNVRNVRQDACLDPYKIEASVGEVMEDVYLPRVMAKDGKAEFTLSGGTDNCVVRVYGFEKLTVPTVEEKVNGKWVSYKLSSDIYEYDGYTVHYDGDGTYSYSFVINMNGGKARTFRVSADKDFKGYEGDWLAGKKEDNVLENMPINVYITPSNYKNLKVGMSMYGCNMEIAEDESYFRFRGADMAVEAYIIPVSNTEIFGETGQYVVMKYRVPTDNSATIKNFEVFTSTVNYGPKAGDYLAVNGSPVIDGEWHVMVVDVSKIESFTARADGSYLANYFRIDIMNVLSQNVPNDTYLDVAYFGMSNSIEDICKLNSDMETITLYQNGSAKTVAVATGEVK